MKKGLVKSIWLIVLLLLAIVLGSVAGEAARGVDALSWLGTPARFGFAPVTLDLSVANVTLGAQISLSAAQAILLAAAILIYIRLPIKD